MDFEILSEETSFSNTTNKITKIRISLSYIFTLLRQQSNEISPKSELFSNKQWHEQPAIHNFLI